MELTLNLVAILFNLIGIILAQIRKIIRRFKVPKKVEPVTNELLLIPAVELAAKIRYQQVKSETIVRAYIERIKAVNAIINAVVEDRFEAAIEDAKRADQIVVATDAVDLERRYPLLGVPFTVKESCGLKGLSQSVGALKRNGIKAANDGEVIANLKAAGAIPLLVSANPEYCVSWECNSLLNGTCKNPYNDQHSPGGSSGGEGALIGAGASLFGVGSDIAGSIRVPALFNGIFGHKPTGTLLSTREHFPTSADPIFRFYLQTGPLCRYASDLPTLLKIMAGENIKKLRSYEKFRLSDLKVYKTEDNGSRLIGHFLSTEVKQSMNRAVKYFQQEGLEVKTIHLSQRYDLLEISLASFFQMQDVPDVLDYKDGNFSKAHVIGKEILSHLIGKPSYSFASLMFAVVKEAGGFMLPAKRKLHAEKLNVLKAELMTTLGNDGILIYPTKHCQAFSHGESFTNLPGVLYTMLFNLLGFPATHIPMGLAKNGLPVGFQVVAGPYNDELCLKVAHVFEGAFGGWTKI